jgi:arylsulfatase A-like enzyme
MIRRFSSFALLGLATFAATPEKPNILFIYTDDYSYRTVSAYPEAYPWVKTPAIESMRMEGKYPGSTYDPAKTPFWPKVFRENGYVTAQIGKWRTGTDTGYGRDWDFQIVWNRPKYTGTSTHYYFDQPSPITAANGDSEALLHGPVHGLGAENQSLDEGAGRRPDAQGPVADVVGAPISPGRVRDR